MKRIYIKGLVSTADTARRELTRPLTPRQRAEFRQWVADTIREVDRILASHHADRSALPAPTRRAYEFLVGLKFDTLPAPPPAEEESAPPGKFSLAGSSAFLDRILHKMAEPVSPERAETLHQAIGRSSRNMESHIAEEKLADADLTAQSRAIRGWTAFFAVRENFDAYLAAVGRARPPFEAALRESARFHLPATIQFRPLRGLYRLRGYSNGTHVCLPVPMIRFTSELFTSVAGAALRNGGRQSVVQATLDDEYQAIQAELEALSGVDEHVAGVHHDLVASFDRVNRKYFGGAMARPRLAWSRAFSGRKLGHHDPIRDTVMISCTLDRPDVPAYALDFLVYHELLHKKLGVRWVNGRQSVHTPEFRHEEQRFEQFAAAEAVLERVGQSG